jgi:hypothetical protein
MAIFSQPEPKFPLVAMVEDMPYLPWYIVLFYFYHDCDAVCELQKRNNAPI